MLITVIKIVTFYLHVTDFPLFHLPHSFNPKGQKKKKNIHYIKSTRFKSFRDVKIYNGEVDENVTSK